ncbi:MAG: peptidoglycan bridge formation glycyltransferase FemA/FemB family protein [bacterium]|nr:peptidoglycan bridge formation glycyltransferase FemA/FemB family protein [bacterium]MDZ4299638.1 peptidoglycan bridge formation glycyltransferase FemA/FemB family protein [Candidatus Sungbacteria bacterium]
MEYLEKRPVNAPPFSDSFLQSPGWEEAQRRAGFQTVRAAGILLIRRELRAGWCALYAPRPSFPDGATANFFSAAEGVARVERALFLKVDPLVSITPPVRRWHFSYSLQPQESIILDVHESEEELRAALHPKTRYNISLAARHGVVITPMQNKFLKDDSALFWTILRETAARDGFALHPRHYYDALAAVRDPSCGNEFFFARYQGKIIAAALMNVCQRTGTATYLHGGSRAEYRAVMAPHLLQWSMIMNAKMRGLRWYDFWGIDAERWPGVTRFKKGFGGVAIHYPSSFDVIYRPLPAWAYRVITRLRR